MIFSKTTTALSALACLTLSATAFAGTHDIESANNQLVVQFLSKNLDYTETANGAVLDTESGRVPGYGFSLSVMKDQGQGRYYIQMQYRSFKGKTDYVGGTLGNPVYGSLIAKSGATIADSSIRYGKGLAINDEFMVTPYGELGYHQWDRNVGDGSPGGYPETYSHLYLGAGALGQYSPFGKLVLSADVLIGSTFGSNINVGLPAPFGFSASLGNSILSRVGVSVDYAFTKNIHANTGVDYTSWKYGASAVQSSGFYEPDSKTKDTTVRAGIGYAF
jgi:hypothetical protein